MRQLASVIISASLFSGLIIVFISALSQHQPQAQNGKPIVVGAVYALTGSAAVWGEYGRKAALLAQDEINQNGGIQGRPLQLQFENSASQPRQAISAFQALVSQHSVRAVVGDVWAMLTNPLIPLAQQRGILLLSPTVVDTSVEARSANFFTMGAQINSARRAVTQFFDTHLEIKTVAIFGWDDSWGRSYTNLWKSVLLERDIAIAAEFNTADFFHDYRSEIALALTRHPDALLIAEGQEPILRALSSAQVTLPILSTSGIVTAHAQKLLPDALVEGVYFTDWIPDMQFIDKFRTRYGIEPLFESFRHYEAIRAVAEALKLSADDPALAIRGVTFDGVAGKVDFQYEFAAQKGEAALCHFSGGRPVCPDVVATN